MKNGIHKTAIAAEAAVEKKVAWIRNDQERRVLALEERQDKMLRHAQLAEAWADEVEKVYRRYVISIIFNVLFLLFIILLRSVVINFEDYYCCY